jgi:antitoxin component YwqK of YwqJK toxin-antitoxin module
MKRFLALVLLMVFLFPSFALAASRGLEMDDLVIREGLYYEKFTDVPFSGKIEGLQRGSFKDGKKDGPWVNYWGNGQLYSRGTYKDGKLHGPWVSYWENGQLSDQGTYKDGKLHGPWVSYWENGNVWEKYTGTYKDGVKVE